MRQTAGIYPIDVEAWNIGLLAFTGHKSLLGPQGTGGLYIAPELVLEPLKYGGTGSASLPDEMPDWLLNRFEGGNAEGGPGIAGLKAAASLSWPRAWRTSVRRCPLQPGCSRV